MELYTRVPLVYVIGFLWCTLCLRAYGADGRVIQPVRTWQGDIWTDQPMGVQRLQALRRTASMRVIGDVRTWEWVWRTLKGDNEKVPEVDFHHQIVFVSLQPGAKDLKARLLRNGKGNVVSLVASMTSRYKAGYVMVSIPRKGLRTVDGRRVPKPPRKRAAN